MLGEGNANLTRRTLGCAVAAGVALWTVVAGAQAPDPSWRDVKLATIATLRIPPGTELREDKIRYPDFRIYRVFNLGTELLGIYLGNAPNFPNRNAAVPVRIGSCVGLSAVARDGNGINRDVLLEIKSRDGFPTALHVFYRKLNADTAEQGDTIIATVSMAEGTQCGPLRR
jgi:hypothetical protein